VYRNQRREPQVIIPDTDHKIGSKIDLEDAPMANRHVQFALRDAQYITLGEARSQMDRGFALKAKLTLNMMHAWPDNMTISAYPGIHRRPYDFLSHPMAPCGTLLVAYDPR
jgi:hypothetical protein